MSIKPEALHCRLFRSTDHQSPFYLTPSPQETP
jgi:hypothetical protein